MQLDFAHAQRIKDDHPAIWKAGGNIRGNEAFTLWSRARDGEETEGVLDWIKEREAWAARHAGDGSHSQVNHPPCPTWLGVVAAMKWGGILDIGEGTMKETITELIKTRENHERRNQREARAQGGAQVPVHECGSMEMEKRELAKLWKGMQPCSTLMQTWGALWRPLSQELFDAALACIPAGCGSALQS